MRATLTIEDDVAARLEQLRRARQASAPPVAIEDAWDEVERLLAEPNAWIPEPALDHAIVLGKRLRGVGATSHLAAPRCQPFSCAQQVDDDGAEQVRRPHQLPPKQHQAAEAHHGQAQGGAAYLVDQPFRLDLPVVSGC